MEYRKVFKDFKTTIWIGKVEHSKFADAKFKNCEVDLILDNKKYWVFIDILKWNNKYLNQQNWQRNHNNSLLSETGNSL